MGIENALIVPDWPAPATVRALQTTRLGGVSTGVYAGLNLGDHVGDAPERVLANRLWLGAHLGAEPLWLKQVHGVNVLDADQADASREADASFTRRAGQACVVLTADCLPLLLCNSSGTAVAAVHAGWRSLCGGIIERTLAVARRPGDEWLAWMGPAIGPRAFEVGDEVRMAFVDQDERAAEAFLADSVGKWRTDIYRLARQRLAAAGVTAIYGGGHCTMEEGAQFYSYRRDGVTGRMGSFIWLEHAGV